jgi:hypothetical protein
MSTRTRLAGLCVSSLAIGLVAPWAYTCIHPPRGFKGSIEQTAQSAVILWHAERQELVLRNNYLITPGDDGQLPAAIAWVVPVPNVPDGYSVENPKLFEELFHLVAIKEPHGGLKDGPRPRSNQSIELLDRASVGEYTIQPIRTRGEGSAEALNGWLTENGFGEIPLAAMHYYIERNWVWLAVKVDMAGAGGEVMRRGGLRPLRISFATRDIVYPLLFSQQQGVFDVVLYVLTEQPLTTEQLQLDRYGFRTGATRQIDPPTSLAEIQKKAAAEGHWTALEKPWLHQLVGRQINAPNRPLSGWTEDFRIVVTPPTATDR